MKNYTHISSSQRIELSTLHRSTIYRELKRNSRPRGSYDAYYANNLSEIRKERFAKNRKFTSQLISLIKEKLEKEKWSPEQIKDYCNKNNIPMISHERIYQYVYEDKTNGGNLFKHLRTGKKKYKKRYGNHKGRKVIIKNKISVDERPEVINNKERYGD